MNLYRSLEAIATSQGDGPIDWDAIRTAANAATDPGSLSLDPGEQDAYSTDVKDARTHIQELTGTQFEFPSTIELIDRHHWIEKNLQTFERIMAPLDQRPLHLPGVTRRINTATLAGMVSFIAKHVLGQYDPLLLADTSHHELYFVRPNIKATATDLSVEYDRFRRWIVFHELTHAAEFSTAPWLTTHLESHITTLMDSLTEGTIDKSTLKELNTTMTVVEGFAEFIMDRAFDANYADLRHKINARRKNHGPLTTIIRHLLGLEMKRKQYENGHNFFEYLSKSNSLDTINVIWESPENLPTKDEITAPARWEARVLH